MVKSGRKEVILSIIYDRVEQDSTIMTDEYSAYNDLAAVYTHKKVNHGAKEYVNQMAHTNGIEKLLEPPEKGY